MFLSHVVQILPEDNKLLRQVSFSGYQKTPPSLPYDSFLRTQMAVAGVDPRMITSNGTRASVSQSLSFAVAAPGVTQSDLANTVFQTLQESSGVNPDYLLTVHHFNNENWFNFTNMQLLPITSNRCISHSIIGMSSLGLPLALDVVDRYFSCHLEAQCAVVVASDCVLPPLNRYVRNRGFLTDGAVALQFCREPLRPGCWEYQTTKFSFFRSPISWYESSDESDANIAGLRQMAQALQGNHDSKRTTFCEPWLCNNSRLVTVDLGKEMFNGLMNVSSPSVTCGTLVLGDPSVGSAKVEFSRRVLRS